MGEEYGDLSNTVIAIPDNLLFTEKALWNMLHTTSGVFPRGH